MFFVMSTIIIYSLKKISVWMHVYVCGGKVGGEHISESTNLIVTGDGSFFFHFFNSKKYISFYGFTHGFFDLFFLGVKFLNHLKIHSGCCK